MDTDGRPDCKTCENGTECACVVKFKIWYRSHPSEDPDVFACGCLGFTGCPDCGRGMRPDTRLGLTGSLARIEDLSRQLHGPESVSA